MGRIATARTQFLDAARAQREGKGGDGGLIPSP